MKTGFIGAGFMGAALLRGLIKSGATAPADIIAADPRKDILDQLAGEFSEAPLVTTDNIEAVKFADVIVLAIKPNLVETILASIKDVVSDEKLIISVAAGVTTETIEANLGANSRVVRAMPNVAASISEAATAITAGRNADTADMAIAEKIFGAIGSVVTVDENKMDSVTGLSGSGPAYVYLFLEGLIDAGVKVGLTRDVAEILATQTLYGAVNMVKVTGESTENLINQITSPGGTTLAGLGSLKKGDFKGIIARAVETATNRSKELGEK